VEYGTTLAAQAQKSRLIWAAGWWGYPQLTRTNQWLQAFWRNGDNTDCQGFPPSCG